MISQMRRRFWTFLYSFIAARTLAESRSGVRERTRGIQEHDHESGDEAAVHACASMQRIESARVAHMIWDLDFRRPQLFLPEETHTSTLTSSWCVTASTCDTGYDDAAVCGLSVDRHMSSVTEHDRGAARLPPWTAGRYRDIWIWYLDTTV